MFKIKKPDGEIKYQAMYLCYQDELQPFARIAHDEMEKIMLWDLKQDIGYVDECDLKMVELSCM